MEANVGLIEHLEELRKRIIRSVIAISISACMAYVFSEVIFDFIRAPIQPYLKMGGLVFTSPADKFVAHLKIAFFAGVILSCPVWIYQVWRFIAPALYAKEKKYAIGFIFSGSLLFIIGIAFAYYLALPAAFEFLLNFGGGTDIAMITIGEYLSFFLMMSLMFGLSFEMPLIIVLLGMMGIVSQKFLRAKRRYMIVFLGFLSAVVTPSPDAASMLVMLVPMVILFEIAVILVGFFEKKT